MYRKPLLCTLLLACFCTASAQKKILEYPFEFEKSALAASNFDAYFLENTQNATFAYILKDNRKVAYLLFDKAFQVIAKIDAQLDNTVFGEGADLYVGGTIEGAEFHFIYSTSKKTYYMETVNFTTRTITHTALPNLLSGDKLLTSFCDNNRYYCLAASNKEEELVLYVMDEKAGLNRKTFAYKVPESARANKISSYLEKMVVIKSSEEPDFSDAAHAAKLFSQPGVITILRNDRDNPTHIFTINLDDFSSSEKFLKYDGIVDDHGKLFMNAYVYNNQVFSLLLNRKDIRIAIHDKNTLRELQTIDLDMDSGLDMMAEPPVRETRMWLIPKPPIETYNRMRMVINHMSIGTEAIMVKKAPSGQLLITAGTFGPPTESPSVRALVEGSSYRGGFRPVRTGNEMSQGATVYDPYLYHVPGYPSYTYVAARNYSSLHFSVLSDSATFKLKTGIPPVSVSTSIKDYLEAGKKWAERASNQFSLDGNQYYGYYDRNKRAYIFEQIKIANR